MWWFGVALAMAGEEKPAAPTPAPAVSPDEDRKGTMDAATEAFEKRVVKVAAFADELQRECAGDLVGQPVCTTWCTVGDDLDFCRLRDPDLVRLAYLADADAAEAWVRAVRDSAAARVQPAADAKAASDAQKRAHKRVNDDSQAIDSETHSAAAVVAAGAGVVAPIVEERLRVALAGLEKFVVDRAKQEGLAWALDELGAELCTDANIPTEVAYELNHQWLRSFCALARGDRLAGYGSGDATLALLQSAVESDVRDIPGVTVGTVLAGMYLTDRAQNAPSQGRSPYLDPAQLRTCANEKTPATADCLVAQGWRDDTRTTFRALLAGKDPLVALDGLGRELAAGNVTTAPVKLPDGTVTKGSLRSAEIEVLACALSLPRSLRSVEGFAAGARSPEAVAFAAAMTGAPACWTMVGRGYAFDAVDKSRGTLFDKSAGRLLGLDDTTRIERITTAFDVYGSLDTSVEGVREQLGHVAAGAERSSDALKDLAEAHELTLEIYRRASPGTDDDGKEDAKKEVSTDEELRKAIENELGAASALLTANLDVLDASVAIADITVRAVDDLYARRLVVGACERWIVVGNAAGCTADGLFLAADAPDFDAVDDVIGRVEQVSSTLRALVAGDYAEAMPALWRAVSEHLCTDQACRTKVDRVSGYAGGAAALVEADDGDDAARALHSVFDPPGGWRQKSAPKNRMWSITAHPAIRGGVEWRRGAYGLRYESWAAYGAPPALALPIGAELAFGTGKGGVSSFTLFAPLIDPVGFGQYDPAQEGAAPRLATALSPGFGARLGFGRSPFGLLGLATWRPQLRAPVGSSGTAADALQLTLGVTVDVTLLRLTSQEKEAK
jgi:hypothetical protein